MVLLITLRQGLLPRLEVMVKRYITIHPLILFSVKRVDGVPRTMFKPDPADHGFKTNLDYFNAQ